MSLIVSIPEMQRFSRDIRAQAKSLALVPALGRLDERHLTLIHEGRRQCDATVVALVQDPTNPARCESPAPHPQNVEAGEKLLTQFTVDAVFVPQHTEMYPQAFETFLLPGYTAASPEAAFRPDYYRGAMTTLLKLFNIVRPDVAYFSQTDFQQAVVVRRMMQDLNLETRLVMCPIERGNGRTAKNPGNGHASAEDGLGAQALEKGLRRIQELVHTGETEAHKLLEEMRKVIAAAPQVQIDYALIVEPNRLQPVDKVVSGCVALVVAHTGSERLTDNLILGSADHTEGQLIDLAFQGQPHAKVHARVPGLETEGLKRRIESCRDCAALSSIVLPPREFLVKYVKSDYPDLNSVEVAVIGRDAPMKRERFLYRQPATQDPFVAELYKLVGVKDFLEFRSRFALTDAVRCHASSSRIPEGALDRCVRHLRDELKLFPNLKAIVVLGNDAYLQFQRFVLGRPASEIKSFDSLLKGQGWHGEAAQVPTLGGRTTRIFYCYHPTLDYDRSPSIAAMLSAA